MHALCQKTVKSQLIVLSAFIRQQPSQLGAEKCLAISGGAETNADAHKFDTRIHKFRR